MALGVKSKVVTIATAGTPTQVDANSDHSVRMNILNPFRNTGVAYFGGSDLAATAQRTLERGESVDLYNVAPSMVYVDVAVNGESVECFWMI